MQALELLNNSYTTDAVEFRLPAGVLFLLAAGYSNHCTQSETRGLGRVFLASTISSGGHDYAIRHTVRDQVDGLTLTRKPAHYLPRGDEVDVEWFIPFTSLETVALTLDAIQTS